MKKTLVILCILTLIGCASTTRTSRTEAVRKQDQKSEQKEDGPRRSDTRKDDKDGPNIKFGLQYDKRKAPAAWISLPF